MTNTTKRKIFVDFEWHAISYEYSEQRAIAANEIIEFGAVMLDAKGRELGRYQSYVKPRFVNRITSRIRELTGITDETIAIARDFRDVLEEFVAWCNQGRGKYEIFSWSGSDLMQIKQEMQLKEVSVTEELVYMEQNWFDLQHEFDSVLGFESQQSLTNALFLAGIDSTGIAHHAQDDARNTAELYVFLSSPENQATTIKTIRSAMGRDEEPKNTLGNMVDWGALMAQVG